MARWVVGSVLLLLALLYITRAVCMIAYPFQLEYGEGTVLVYSMQYTLGLSPYRPLESPPHVACIYTPFFLMLSSFLMAGTASLQVGRALSVTAALLTLVGLVSYVKNRRGALAAAFAASFFLLHPLPLNWFYVFRTDSLALCLTLGGLYLVSRAASSGWKSDLLAAAVFFLAIWTKQSFIAGPIAASLWLFLQQPRRGLRFGAALGLILMAALVTLNYTTAGQAYQHMVVLNGKTAAVFIFPQVLEYFGAYLVSVLPLLLLLAFWLPRAGRWRQEGLFVAYLCFSTGIAFGCGRIGGFYNYFLEFHLALSILSGMAVADLLRQPFRAAWLVVGLQWCLAATTTLPPYLYAPLDVFRYETLKLASGHYPGRFSRGWDTHQLQPWLDRYGGPVLAENMGNVVVHGQVPWFCDPAFFMFMAMSGQWDEDALLQPIRQQTFRLITLQVTERNGRFSPRAIATILHYYKKVGQAGVDQIFLPKSPQELRASAP